MPRAKAVISQEDKIKAFQDGTAPKVQVAPTLPTPEEQQSAVEEVKSHLITLLDDTIVELKTDLTVGEVLTRRLNAKVHAFMLLVRSELAPYVSQEEREQALLVIMAASDTLYEKALELLAQFTGKAVGVFRDNISSGELVKAILTLYNAVVDTLKNAEAVK